MSRLRSACHALRARTADESGNAIVEFVGLSVVLLIPLAYLVLWLGAVQNASYAATAAAAQSARIVAVHGGGADGESRLNAAVTSLAGDYSVQLSRSSVRISCSEANCEEPSGTVRADVSIPVPLPGLGAVGLGQAPVTVSATHVYPIDPHAEQGHR